VISGEASRFNGRLRDVISGDQKPPAGREANRRRVRRVVQGLALGESVSLFPEKDFDRSSIFPLWWKPRRAIQEPQQWYSSPRRSRGRFSLAVSGCGSNGRSPDRERVESGASLCQGNHRLIFSPEIPTAHIKYMLWATAGQTSYTQMLMEDYFSAKQRHYGRLYSCTEPFLILILE